MPGYSTPEVDAAIARAADDLTGRVRQEGPVLEVLFQSSVDRRDVAHGLGTIPTGFITVLEVGGQVEGVDVASWTPELAYLTADAGCRARLFFVKTEEPVRA